MQRQIVKALMMPEAYDENVKSIALDQTHISFIFLTEKFVYKVKKAVNLGFLDFTTLERRRFFCGKELELNRRLCEDMYLEVVPINRSYATQAIKMKGDGETVEYAVKMKKIPQEAMMSNLLEEGRVDNRTIDKIARILARFHSEAETSKDISKFGSSEVIETNWNENFQQTHEFVGRAISERDFESTKARVADFIKKREVFFRKRIKDGKIRDCHGDIHSGNIFVADKVYIFDAIEFNQRFRYSDVASDVAFLAMDLDFNQRADLSKFFIERYVEYSRDSDVTELLPFYKCYRAYVRGKVNSFRLKDPNIGESEKTSALEEAKAYFKLASNYSKKL